MKVLQINVVYKTGSTGKIVYDLHQGLTSRSIESYVCYGRGNSNKDNNVIKISSEFYSKLNNLFSRISGIPYGGCTVSTLQLFRIIEKIRPDIVHIHCINGYFVNVYNLIQWLNNNNFPLVLTLHAEFMFTANCSHSFDCERWKTGCGSCPNLKQATNSYLFDRTRRSWNLMNDSFNNYDNAYIVSVSDWLRHRSEQSPILGNFRNITILNGIDTSTFFYHQPSTSMAYIERLFPEIKCRKTVLHVTAAFNDSVNHIKGGYYLIKLAERLPDLQFLVVGNYSLKSKLPDNVVLLGNIENRDVLAMLYSISDVTLLTSKRETFSMICAESLCCGTPVIGFKAGGPESISLPEYSRFCEHGDIDGLVDILDKLPSFDAQTVSETAIKAYNIDAMINHYVNLYNQLCEYN